MQRPGRSDQLHHYANGRRGGESVIIGPSGQFLLASGLWRCRLCIEPEREECPGSHLPVCASGGARTGTKEELTSCAAIMVLIVTRELGSLC